MSKPDEREPRARPAAVGSPSQPSWDDDRTPLPSPLPYHLADPTSGPVEKLSEADLLDAELADTPLGTEPGTWPRGAGLGNAARMISASLIGAATPDAPATDRATRTPPRGAPVRASTNRPQATDLDEDAETVRPGAGHADDELTEPR